MAKNIQWKKSTLDYNKLNELTPHKIAAINNGKNRGSKNKEEGKIGASIGDKESRRRGAKASHITQKESGAHERFRLAGTAAAAKKAIDEKIKRKDRFTYLIEKHFGNNDFNILELDIIFNEFPEYTTDSSTKKRFGEFVLDETIFKFIGFKNKSKRYKKL